MPQQPWTILVNGREFSAPATHEADRLWVATETLPSLLGWQVKDATLCRPDRCIPLASLADAIRGDEVDLPALAAQLNMPRPRRRPIGCYRWRKARNCKRPHCGMTRRRFRIGRSVWPRASTRRLPWPQGTPVVWASWCGCREDLPDWQAQHSALSDFGLTVITVSQDSRAADAAPFIEAASPEHPSLLDPNHIVSHLYGLINVPTAIWIDEAGRIARPPRVEHASNRFAFAHGLDCAPHLASLRRWAETGETDFSPGRSTPSYHAASFAEQQARANHALAWHLYQLGATEEATEHWQAAIELSPHDWTIRRGSMWLRGENSVRHRIRRSMDGVGKRRPPDYAKLAAARSR
ncbi:MAG: redoxin domain-containing protein [Rhodospirillales bacterium]